MRLFDRTFLEFPIRQGTHVTLADYKDEIKHWDAAILYVEPVGHPGRPGAMRATAHQTAYG